MCGEDSSWALICNILLIPDTTRIEGRFWSRRSGRTSNSKGGTLKTPRPIHDRSTRNTMLANTWFVMLLLVVGSAPGIYGNAQTSLSFAEVKALYVEPFTGGSQAAALRESFIHRLKKSGKYQIVDSPQNADATVKGAGQIWVRGHFTTNSDR